MKLLGVDTGGTFTDLVLYDNGKLRVHKTLSTPRAPEQAILAGVHALGLDARKALVIAHGTTVGTNAVLEGKGVRTAYITNRGFGDVLTIGRQARRQLYNLTPDPVAPPVAPELCLETGGRISSDGEVLEGLSNRDKAEILQKLKELAPVSVAVNLLFSFVDDRFERELAELLPDDYFVSLSSDVLPEGREYERGIATWLNSYVSPLMQGYLHKLDALLPAAKVSVMQSHGKTITAAKAGEKAVQLLLSGPAGGVIAVQQLSALSGCSKALSFDMGGTSTDVSLISGDVTLTNEGRIGRFPVSVPMVDIHTIGAGGGSIAYVDEGGLLRVGPQSARAMPGPACYGNGGQRPTVTDANLLLGRLPQQIGDNLMLDRQAAERAFDPLVRRLDMSLDEVANGVVAIVNEHTSQALKVMSAQRGENPADYLLVGFGAAGGLHICALAESLQMRKAMVPANAGVLSALGMLTAEQGIQKSQALYKTLEHTDEDDIELVFRRLSRQAEHEMREQGITAAVTKKFVDLRYRGQWHCFTLGYCSKEKLTENFHDAYENLRGYRMDAAVELVNLKIRMSSPARLSMTDALRCLQQIRQPESRAFAPDRSLRRQVPVFRRDGLGRQTIVGPAIVAETVGTVYVDPGWRARLDDYGNLRLSGS